MYSTPNRNHLAQNTKGFIRKHKQKMLNAGIVLALVALNTTGLAQPTTITGAFQSANTVLCQIATGMAGNIMLAVGAIMVIIGALKVMTGNRDGQAVFIAIGMGGLAFIVGKAVISAFLPNLGGSCNV